MEKGNDAVEAFAGSANYTQTAFSERQREILVSINPKSALEVVQNLDSDSIYCNAIDDIMNVSIIRDNLPFRIATENAPKEIIEVKKEYSGLEKATLTLLGRNGQVPLGHSGLNWGVREKREQNQAYIPIRGSVRKSGFFLELGVHFTVLTDDNISLICSRAQQGAKAIHTPHNNSLIGKYLRN